MAKSIDFVKLATKILAPPTRETEFFALLRRPRETLIYFVKTKRARLIILKRLVVSMPYNIFSTTHSWRISIILWHNNGKSCNTVSLHLGINISVASNEKRIYFYCRGIISEPLYFLSVHICIQLTDILFFSISKTKDVATSF